MYMKPKSVKKLCLHCNSQFLAKQKEVNRGHGHFCSISCSASYFNLRRGLLASVAKTCNHCGKTFNTTNVKKLYCCTLCKTKYSYRMRHAEGNSVNHKTLILLPCEVCGWKEATRDLHHIIPISEGGSNDDTNLVTLCPNHHRCAHNNLVSQEQLKAIAMSRTMSSPAWSAGVDALAGN